MKKFIHHDPFRTIMDKLRQNSFSFLVENLLWCRITDNNISFWLNGLPLDVHFTLAFNSNSHFMIYYNPQIQKEGRRLVPLLLHTS